jgi:hypothetical protein
MFGIDSVDIFLVGVLPVQPQPPRLYELHCHPDVILAIRATAPNAIGPQGSIFGRFGEIAVSYHAELKRGEWKLCADGQLLNSGQLEQQEQREGKVTVYLQGGPCDGERLEVDGRPCHIDRGAVFSKTAPPQPTRYVRTGMLLDVAEVYRYAPGAEHP